METTHKIYFPGLNGLRFIAALCVIITHIESEKLDVGLANYWTNIIVFNLGSLGVYFFFVLSGFLITFLLLTEQRKTATISVSNFYLRRIFRIWPLYYLLVIIGFFVLPNFEFFHHSYYHQFLHAHFWTKFFLFLFILPNLALAIYPGVSLIGHSWSIGVEEQFYLIWPIIIKYSKNALKTIIGFTFCWILLKAIVLLFSVYYGKELIWLNYLKLFLAMSKIECMTIGAVGAYVLFFERTKILYLVYSKSIQIFAFLSIPLLLLFTPNFLKEAIHIIFSVVFIIIILNVATNANSILKLNYAIFDFLGKISYGIYMYHFVVLFIVIKLLLKYLNTPLNYFVFNILCYSLSLIITVMLAWISYDFFEKRFIDKKKRYN